MDNVNWSDWIDALYKFTEAEASTAENWESQLAEECLLPLHRLIACESLALYQLIEEKVYQLLWSFPNRNPKNPSFISHPQPQISFSEPNQVVLPLQESERLALEIQFTSKQDPRAEDWIRTLNTINGHLTRAVRIIEEKQLHTARQSAHKLLLERWHTGVVMLDDTRHILYCNQAAQHIMAKHGELEFYAKNLSHSSRRVTSPLKQAIENAIDAHIDGHSLEPRLIKENLANAELSILVTVPSVQDPPSYWKGDTACILYMEDSSQPLYLELDYLKTHYKMTHREAQVAMGVVNGEDTLEIATKHFVSEETVRKQLKAVRKKTQTSNRIELIRKLMDAGHHSFSFSSQSH